MLPKMAKLLLPVAVFHEIHEKTASSNDMILLYFRPKNRIFQRNSDCFRCSSLRPRKRQSFFPCENQDNNDCG